MHRAFALASSSLAVAACMVDAVSYRSLEQGTMPTPSGERDRGTVEEPGTGTDAGLGSEDAPLPPPQDVQTPRGFCDRPAEADGWDDFEVGFGEWTASPSGIRIDSATAVCGTSSVFFDAPTMSGNTNAPRLRREVTRTGGTTVLWSFLLRVEELARTSAAQVHFAKLFSGNDNTHVFLFFSGETMKLRLGQQRTDGQELYPPNEGSIDGFHLGEWQQYEVTLTLGATPNIVLKIGEPGGTLVERFAQALPFPMTNGIVREDLGVSFATGGAKLRAYYDRYLLDLR